MAANNIRRFSESGHTLVIDDNDPKRLKIIKQFKPGPQAKKKKHEPVNNPNMA